MLSNNGGLRPLPTQGVETMKTLFLGIIAACAFAHTFAIYESESGGVNIYFGNFGYHIAESE